MSLNFQEMDVHQSHDSGGIIARSYDCVFCQRGFTTAQALGGHMNIHRKDRATNNNNNNKATSTTTNHHLEGLNKKHEVVISTTKQGVLEEDNYDDYHINDATTRLLLFSPKKGVSSHHTHHLEGRFNRFGSGSAWVGDSSSRIGSNMIGKRIQGVDHGQEGEELDLELRLGQYPW